MRKAIDTRRGGFTLIELLVVITIIGLLISLVLVASADGVRRAEERATQALITKLETALNDRLDALLNIQAPINQTHRFLASINSIQGGFMLPVGSSTSNSDDRRAQVIAQFDYIKAELPDVFFVNSLASDGPSVANLYPLNFAAAPYPAGTSTLTSGYTGKQDGGSWVLPLGNLSPGVPLNFVNGQPVLSSPYTNPLPNLLPMPTTGMFGASFSAAGGIYKNLYGAAASDLLGKPVNSSCAVNALPAYDGVDNNGNGLIDDLSEVIVTGSPDQPFSSYLQARLAKHTHKTARSEMLYAILVEGLSPLGSSFSREDFTAREVMDTDGDGLPEFVDAWGEPLQFFRWPLYYGASSDLANGVNLGTSDSQKGYDYYANGPSEARQQDPLDPGQLLVSPGWWYGVANPSLPLSQLNSVFVPPNGNSTSQSSPGAIAFMNYFHSLVEPFPKPIGGTGWDRGGNFSRREYFTKFLILSAGPDREPGVAQFGKDYHALVDNPSSLPSSPYAVGTAPSFPSGQTMEQSARLLIYIENQAAVIDPVYRVGSSSGSFFEIPDTALTQATIYLNSRANADDITNHNISGVSTGVR